MPTSQSNKRKRKRTQLIFDVVVARETNSTNNPDRNQDTLAPTPEERQHDLLGWCCVAPKSTGHENKETGPNTTTRVLEVTDLTQKETAPEPSTSPTTNWWEQWELLQKFYQQNHHCNVPVSQQPLHDWVERQRAYFSKADCPLSPRQRAALARLGLSLDLEEWNSQYEKFRRGQENTPELAQWIQQQRNNPILPLNKQQKQLLEALPGWEFQNRVSKKSSNPPLPNPPDNPSPNNNNNNKNNNKEKKKQDATWERQYAKLHKFQQEHGHCNLPKNTSDPKLKIWINTQRTNHRLRKMPQHRIAKLEAIQFPWSLERTWNDQYERLKQYQQETGNCHVPNSWDDTQLVQWVSRQRSFFKTGTLSRERIQLLESIGFVWDAKEYRGGGGGRRRRRANTSRGKPKKTLPERLAWNNKQLQAQQAKLQIHQEDLDEQQKKLQENGETIEFLLQHLRKASWR